MAPHALADELAPSNMPFDPRPLRSIQLSRGALRLHSARSRADIADRHHIDATGQDRYNSGGGSLIGDTGSLGRGLLAGSYDITTRDQLQDEHPNDTLELFNKTPGVSLSRYNQGIINTDVAIRGFAGDGTTPHAKLLIDGIPSHLHNGYGELDQLFPSELAPSTCSKAPATFVTAASTRPAITTSLHDRTRPTRFKQPTAASTHSKRRPTPASSSTGSGKACLRATDGQTAFAITAKPISTAFRVGGRWMSPSRPS